MDRDAQNENGDSFPLSEDHIRSLLLVRRAREDLLGENLFSDPAWDILLELLAAKLAGNGVTLLDLAQAIEAPVSTVARWIGILKQRGLIQSDVDAEGIHLFCLSPDGASRLEMLARRWATAFVSIGYSPAEI